METLRVTLCRVKPPKQPPVNPLLVLCLLVIQGLWEEHGQHAGLHLCPRRCEVLIDATWCWFLLHHTPSSSQTDHPRPCTGTNLAVTNTQTSRGDYTAHFCTFAGNFAVVLVPEVAVVKLFIGGNVSISLRATHASISSPYARDWSDCKLRISSKLITITGMKKRIRILLMQLFLRLDAFGDPAK